MIFTFDNSLLLILISVIGAMPPTLMGFLAWRRGFFIQKTADEIHMATNSTLSALRQELLDAKEKIDGLESLIREHITNKRGKK
jgi:hypothetical protein